MSKLTKYFIELAYHGGRYHGWQRQTNAISVQEVIETCLSRLLKHQVHVAGCGRTDTGVHASQYFAHIRLEEDLPEDFIFKMNKILPADIAFYRVCPVDEKAHAQHNAILRTYQYHLHTIKNPLINQTSLEVDFRELNIDLVQSALRIVEDCTDFKSVCRHPHLYKTTLCDVTSAQFLDDGPGRMYFEFKANRFLRAMIRILVSKLLKVGQGRLSIQQFEDILLSGNTFPYYDPAPPQGLCLTGVMYPFEVG